ncbi:MAG TPA: hypothetical protein VKB53_08525 [Gammaproteobacteria bacterium]|nr:hypothetical protein [Gammaproteobacteria bacterium]
MGCSHNTYQDRWTNQSYRVFCMVEKDALSGVLASTCYELDIPLLAARGRSPSQAGFALVAGL